MLTMLTLLTQLPRGPEISCTALPRRMRGQLGLRGQAPASRGAVMAAPLLRLGAGERPGRESQLGRSERAPAAGIVARDLDSQLACVLVVLESRNQQRRVAGGQCHTAPPITSNGARGKAGASTWVAIPAV